MVDHTEIAENEYSLSVTSYVVAEDTREEVDIKELNKSISEIVARQISLRNEIDRIVTDIEGASN